MNDDDAPAPRAGAMSDAAESSAPVAETGSPNEAERDRISRERRRLLRFLLRLGHLLLATGSPVRLVETTLQRVATVHKIAQFNVLALPTVLFVNFAEEDDVLQIEFTAEQGLVLRFDQIEATFELARDAERAPLDPTEGLRRINAILAMPPRYRWQWDLLGHVLATVGIALVLRPTIDLIGAVAFFGLLVGGLRLVSRQRGILNTLLPTFSAFVVVLVSLVGAKHGMQISPTYVLIASLLTFLPGGTLATATVELAYGDMISSSSRLISGLLQLVFLILGMLAAASLVGLPADQLLTPAADSLARTWAPWLAALLFGVGHWLHYSATPRALPWMVLVLLIAQAGQILGNAVFGGYMSGFVAAMLITPASYMVQYRFGGPPSMVTFTPALWILVPGSLGLIGMAELASDNRLAGLENFVTTIFSIVAIALGTVVGTALYNLLFEPVFVRAGNMADLMLRFLRLRR